MDIEIIQETKKFHCFTDDFFEKEEDKFMCFF
jgi:hypothetical protein